MNMHSSAGSAAKYAEDVESSGVQGCDHKANGGDAYEPFTRSVGEVESDSSQQRTRKH